MASRSRSACRSRCSRRTATATTCAPSARSSATSSPSSDLPGGFLRILWVATKSPEPPVDGGRRLLSESLEALAGRGARVALVAPRDRGLEGDLRRLERLCEPRLVETRVGGAIGAGVRSLATGEPWALARHRWPALAREVGRMVAREAFDLVVAEQLHAATATAPARDAGVPLLLRAQNVESALWLSAAKWARGVAGVALAREGRRLAEREAAALAGAAAVVALSSEDGGALAALAAGRACIEVVPPPFPAHLPPARSRLEGEPALVLFGSRWEPNREGERFFLEQVWPLLRRELPGARLYWFGGRLESAPEGCLVRPSPAKSEDAFAPGSILVLPLRVASGVRMRLLEAWARGVPVVATPEAASGLEIESGREALLGSGPEALTGAVRRLVEEPGLAERMIAAGRERLEARHAPERFAERFLAIAQRVAASR